MTPDREWNAQEIKCRYARMPRYKPFHFDSPLLTGSAVQDFKFGQVGGPSMSNRRYWNQLFAMSSTRPRRNIFKQRTRA